MNPSQAHPPILTTLKAIALRVVHTKCGQNWIRNFRADVKNMNLYMFLTPCVAPTGPSSLIGTTIIALVIRVMHYKFNQNWARNV